jgi:hypothetical protein
VLIYLAEKPRASKGVLRGAAKNCFRPEERALLLARLGQRRTVKQCARDIAKELTDLQAQDRAYWSRIVHELRKMRREGKLLPEGLPVSRLCPDRKSK